LAVLAVLAIPDGTLNKAKRATWLQKANQSLGELTLKFSELADISFIDFEHRRCEPTRRQIL
jgi:hypothetical protein